MQITQQFNCSQIEFEQAKSRDNISLTCPICRKTYYKNKKNILNKFKTRGTPPMFCSNICQGLSRTNASTKTTTCKNCNKTFKKKLSEIRKTNNDFCSQSCAATFNNKNKSHGNRRSNFEMQLETKLIENFQDITFLFSDKKTIGSELDVYIPSLKLAFEIQGIFHYKPIFGQEKLDKIKSNDYKKELACECLGISLVKVDISKLKTYKETEVKPYNDYIFSEIKSRLPSHSLTSSA